VLSASALSEASELAARVTATEYVFVVVLSGAVTTTDTDVAAFAVKVTALLATPDATAAPLTVTAAPECSTLGVSVTEATEFATVTV
jgi:hypothetical protein